MLGAFILSAFLIVSLWVTVLPPLSLAYADVLVSPAVKHSPVKLRLESYLSTVTFGDVPQRRRWYPFVPGEEVIGNSVLRFLIQGPETLVELARLFDLGFNELRDANSQVNIWLPSPGTVVRAVFRYVFPATQARIAINLPEMRLYHKRRDGWVDTYPIGIGREGLATPVGAAVVVRKKESPSWYVPASILREKPDLPRIFPPGPDNPLGSHAVYLSISGYLIHGTNQPFGIGRRVSHGCIRLYPEDIERFFNEVVVHDTVEIVNQPVKAGWLGEHLFLEVHDVFSMAERAKLKSVATTVISQALTRRQSLAKRVRLDWRLVDKMLKQADGIPRVVGRVQHPSSLLLFKTGLAKRLQLHE